MTKHSTVKSPRKVYLAIVGISTAVMLVLGLIGTVITYPTEQHRAVARQQQHVIDQHGGGAFNVDALNSKEYTDLANSPQATYSATANGVVSFVQFILYCILLGLVYNYLRRKNVSPTRRALGATVFLVTLSSQISSILLLLPMHWLLAQPIGWGVWTIPLYLLTFATSLGLSFIIVWLFERDYNKRHSFTVE